MIESKALTGDDLALADVWEVAVHGRPVSLADSARERMGAAREIVEHAAHGRREHTYGVNTGFGRFVSRSIPEELTEELQLRLLRSHACGVGEPYPDEIVRAAMLLRANALAKGYSGARAGHRRAARRVPQSRRAAACAEPRLRRRQRRPGTAGPSRAAADRRGRGHVRGDAPLRRRRPGAGRAGARAAAGEGRALARQRHAVHGRLRRARRDPRRPDREDRGHRLLALARGAPGLPHELPAADSRAAAAEGPVGLGCERAPAARGLGDQRVASLVRPGAGRLFAPLRAAGARRLARPARLRAADGCRRAQRRHRQPTRPRRRRHARLERELPRPAAGASRSTRPRSRSPSSRTSPSGASSGSSTRASRAGCRRS